MTTQRKCFLKSNENIHPPLQILETETFFGRSRETLIPDTFCSRKQISIRADMKNYCVYIKQLGINPSALNGLLLAEDQEYEGRHLDIVEILHNKYFHEIIFEPPPPPVAMNEIEESVIEKSDRSESEKNPVEAIKKNDVSEANELLQNRKRCATTDISELPTKKQKDPFQPAGWEHIDNGKLLIYTSDGVQSREKIAAYDIDGTIIKTKSGNVFAKSTDDWQIAYAEVPGKIKSFHKDQYKIVFFTNQAAISKGTLKIPDYKKKIERIVAKINVPIQVYISTGKGEYRKPMIGMWKALSENKNDRIVIDKTKSFFVGDAAGRPEKKIFKRKKDHSLADRLMATNVGIKFYTPEEHFQQASKEQWIKPEFDPKTYSPTDLLIPSNSKLCSSTLEVIILVGGPGSGKSHFAKTYFKVEGYEIINRDKLKSWQKCVSALDKCLSAKISAVVDNTNGDKESRKRYIDIATKYNVSCRCFVMNTSYKHAKHNIVFREMIDSNHAPINDMVINKYKSTYKEPKKSEGFLEIIKVNLIPKFNRKDHEELYRMYLLD